MGKVYVGQSYLILYVETGTDLAEAGNVVINGEAPDGTTISSLSATIEDSPSGLVSYNVTSSDFTVAGTYKLWVTVNYSGGSVSYGEPFHLNIYDIGN